MRLVADLESNGLLHEMDRVHCIVLRDLDTDEIHSCADQPGYKPIEEGLKLVEAATQLVGHNLINFDLDFLQRQLDQFSNMPSL